MTKTGGSRAGFLLETCFLAVIYAALARLGQLFAIEPGNITPVYLPAGLAVCCLLLRGRRAWLAIWLGQFIGNIWAFVQFDSLAALVGTCIVGAVMGLGALAQAIAGTTLIHCFCANEDILERAYGPLVVGASALVACLISSSVGVTSLLVYGLIAGSDFAATWVTWYLGDATGFCIGTFIFLGLWWGAADLIRDAKRWEFLLMVAAVAGSSVADFLIPQALGLPNIDLTYLPLPALIWAGLRFGKHGVAIGMAILMAVALMGTASGSGPFVSATPSESILTLLSYLAVVGVTAQVLAATVAERQRFNDALVWQRDHLELLVAERTQSLRQREASLRASETHLRITLDSIGDGVITTDIASRVQRMNPVAERLTGWSLAEARDRNLSDVCRVLDGQTRTAAGDPAAEAIASGTLVELDTHCVLVARDGAEYQISSSGAPMRDAEGQLVGAVLVFRDVTEEREMREQLIHSQKMQAIGQLAGGIAHDFNNMLSAVVGAVELVDIQIADNPALSKLTQLAIESAERASHLTVKLLAFARKTPLAMTTVDVHEVLGETVALLENTIDPRIGISTDLSAEASLIRGDTAPLQSAFLNLGINAAQSMADGGQLDIRSRVIELSRSDCQASPFPLEPGPHIEITFSDSGSGIAPENMTRIFEPFFTTKAAGEGTGLGLAAVYGTMQNHQGAITAASTVGVGTTMTVLLPVAGDVSRPDLVAHSTAAACMGSGRILLVEDEAAMRLTTRATLESLGYQVVVAEDGNRGLAIFEREPRAFDLVIIDIIMPGMNGRDCFAAMRAHDPDIPMIACSGFAKDDDIESMQSDGLKGFLRKPFRRQELAQLVHRVMGGRR